MPLSGGLGAGSLALVLSSSVGSLLGKLVYQLEGPGRGGTVHPFEKPWASTLFMFIGMAACLPAAAVARYAAAWLRRFEAPGEGGSATEPLLLLSRLQRRSPAPPLLGRRSPGTPGSVASTANSLVGGPAAALWGGNGNAAGPEGGGSAGAPSWRALALVLVPTCFDLVATILLSVGLLHITASVFSMVRGSEIVFSALLATAFLRRHLNRWHLNGIALCTAGVTLVGAASFLEGAARSTPSHMRNAADPSSQASPRELLLGIGLVLAAEAVQAGQVVVEDLFLHSLDLAPLTVVGFEGLYGVLLMCGVLPVVQLLPGREGGGIHEDSIDTLAQLAHSPAIRAAAIWLTIAMAVYNIAGMLVTDSLGAVSRTVLETLKTLFVWVLNLLAFYASDRRLGEAWTGHSWLQAAGFAVLVGGTMVYAHGEEVQARRLRAKLRWARLRESLATLVPARWQRHPLLPPRIAGPGRISAAFIQPAAVQEAVARLEELLEEHSSRATPAAAAPVAGPAAAAASGGPRLPAGLPAPAGGESAHRAHRPCTPEYEP
ncbi:hypothetical protein ABPG75_013417 [Micractinium tetrahymenae]